MITNKLYRHFGLEGPREGILETRTTREITRRISDCIHDNDYLAVIAGIGSGKTSVSRQALLDIKAKADFNKGREALVIIPVVSTAERGLNYGDILDEIIEELGDKIKQHPARSVRARAKQVSRIMVLMAEAGIKVSLVIDRAHFLHFETIKALKGLRELSFYSDKPLFSVILIGEPSLGEKIARTGEVKARISRVPMEYDSVEMQEIITFHGQGLLQDADIRVLADRYTKPMYFLADLKTAMNNALLMDQMTVTLADFPAAPSVPAPQVHKKGRKPVLDAAGLAKLREEAGIPHQEAKVS